MMATKSSVKPIGLKPLGSRVIIEPIEAGDQTAVGIYLPENAKEKPQKGVVLAIGPGTRDADGKLIPLDVSVGDEVIFGKYAGSEIKVDDRKLLIMQESDLFAIVEK